MITLQDIKDALNPQYIMQDVMEECQAGMKFSISSSREFILFNSDYKVARFTDCFNPHAVLLNKMADYIIFTIKNNTIHVVIVELKASADPRKQLDLTEYFVDYVLKRILYKHRSNMNFVKRKVGAFKKLPSFYKGMTKPGRVYNDEGYAFTDSEDFRLAMFL